MAKAGGSLVVRKHTLKYLGLKKHHVCSLLLNSCVCVCERERERQRQRQRETERQRDRYSERGETKEENKVNAVIC